MKSIRMVLAVLALAAFAFAAGKPQTFTGKVSDSMCGAKHMEGGNLTDAQCTRECVKGGSDYALVVGDKVYTLKANDAQKTELDKLAGENATVTGSAEGTTITVASVAAAAAK